MLIKKIFILLAVLLVVAVGFQLFRSHMLTRLIKNVNELEALPAPVSADMPEGARFEKYLMVSDPLDKNSIDTVEQLKKMLDYMRKEYSSIDVSEGPPEGLEFDCIFFLFERLDHLKGLQDYIDYVETGGNIVFLIRPLADDSLENMKGLLGIEEIYGMDNEARGIDLVSDIIFGARGFKSDTGTIINSSLDLKLKSTAEVFAASYKGLPLVWRVRSGSGSFTVFNGTMFNSKINRSLMLGVLSLGKKDLIYPVVNIKMLHIDDFPAPIPQGEDPAIMEEFSRDIPQFYREIWWSDMIRIGSKHGLKYTGFVIENYGNTTNPPFEKADADVMENMMIYGRELLNSGGEIALHGYNHQPLAPEGHIKQDLGYTPWAGKEDMEGSIKELLGFINSVFPNYKLGSYIPPSNILSGQGRDALISANKDLKVISALYIQDSEGNEYVQEFEIAPDGIIEFPRLSSGYFKSEEMMWSIYNGINLFGIFSHFIHPDDILDPYRSRGKSWSELSKEFDTILSEITGNYPWLRSFTATPAGEELRKYLECVPRIDYSGSTINIYCENFRPDIYLIMRSDSEISDTQNLDYIKISDNSYLLTLKDPAGTIILEEAGN